jgi:hypothetical protein
VLSEVITRLEAHARPSWASFTPAQAEAALQLGYHRSDRTTDTVGSLILAPPRAARLRHTQIQYGTRCNNSRRCSEVVKGPEVAVFLSA